MRHYFHLLTYLISIFVFSLSLLSAKAQEAYKRIKVSKDIELIQLSANAYMHVSYGELPHYGRFPSNGLLYVNNGEAFLFDTPINDSLTQQLVMWVKDSMHVSIVGFVPNHWHSDCMGGLKYLQGEHIRTYANQRTIDIAKEKHLAVPAQGFNDSLQLMLGDKRISCYYLGAAHSTDNIVVWLAAEKILFAGCMIKSYQARDLGNTVDGDLLAYPKTIDRLLAKFSMAKIVVPGHGDCGGVELIMHTKELTGK